MTTILKKALPRRLLRRLKRLVLPPKTMIFVGGPSYKRIGDEFFGYFLEYGRITPGATVLDIGCGIGRMARPLTTFLDSTGRYEGIDIDRSAIDWCGANITRRFPNFRFQVADVHNKRYNPKGRYLASEYKLPFQDETFDFVFLTSVFTHMLADDVANYLAEASRVSKRGGRSLITYFLWNEASSALAAAGTSSIEFKRVTEHFLVMDADFPEDATCFSETYVRDLYARNGLRIEEPILFGSWSGRSRLFSYQDIVVATKE